MWTGISVSFAIFCIFQCLTGQWLVQSESVNHSSHVGLFATPWTVDPSVRVISQASILEWVAISYSRGSSQPRDQTRVSFIVGRLFTISAIRVWSRYLIFVTWVNEYSSQPWTQWIWALPWNMVENMEESSTICTAESSCLHSYKILWKLKKNGQKLIHNYGLILSSWRSKWQPTPVFLPGESHGWRSLVGCRPWGHKELDTAEQPHFRN